jgi:hypothetical protein
MNDPATAEVWQTAFGKDFGGMAQGDNKTGQKGTNAMFVMTHDEVAHVLRDGKKFMFANPMWIIVHKKMIPIVYASPQWGTWSVTTVNCPCKLQTSTLLKYIGTVS